jgi:hypothetical protein
MKQLEILDIKISYQTHFWSRELKAMTIHEVFEEIKNDKHSQITNNLRELYNNNDKASYTNLKKRLPVVTFCGLFENGRTKEDIKQYYNTIVLDIDKLGKDELERIKECLRNEPQVFAFWESPSKDGIKGIVTLDYKFEIKKYDLDSSHKIAFNQVLEYFKNTYNIILDNSGSDFTRLCFISCDKDIFIKDQLLPFKVFDIPIKKHSKNTNVILKKSTRSKATLYNSTNKNSPFQKKTILNIIKFLVKNNLSITNSYDNWLRVGYAIVNSFTFDIGIKYFNELCKLDPEKYNEIECENFLKDCYFNSKGEIKFSTIIHFACEKGFNYKNIDAEST